MSEHRRTIGLYVGPLSVGAVYDELDERVGAGEYQCDYDRDRCLLSVSVPLAHLEAARDAMSRYGSTIAEV